jgi:hypothetical protein
VVSPEAAETLAVIRDMVQVHPDASRAALYLDGRPPLRYLHDELFRARFAGAPSDRAIDAAADKAEVINAAYPSGPIPSGPHGQEPMVRTEITIRNPIWRESREARIGIAVSRLGVACRKLTSQGYPTVRGIDMQALIDEVDAEALVTAELLRWPADRIRPDKVRPDNRRIDPAFNLASAQIAHWRHTYPNVLESSFRFTLCRLRVHAHRIPFVLSWLDAHPSSPANPETWEGLMHRIRESFNS